MDSPFLDILLELVDYESQLHMSLTDILYSIFTYAIITSHLVASLILLYCAYSTLPSWNPSVGKDFLLETIPR